MMYGSDIVVFMDLVRVDDGLKHEFVKRRCYNARF